VAGFPTATTLASWTGTAPIDASSGEQVRHRLWRAGNRRLNHVSSICGPSQAVRPDGLGHYLYQRQHTPPRRCGSSVKPPRSPSRSRRAGALCYAYHLTSP
jgi:hypothetical protein